MCSDSSDRLTRLALVIVFFVVASLSVAYLGYFSKHSSDSTLALSPVQVDGDHIDRVIPSDLSALLSCTDDEAN